MTDDPTGPSDAGDANAYPNDGNWRGTAVVVTVDGEERPASVLGARRFRAQEFSDLDEDRFRFILNVDGRDRPLNVSQDQVSML